MTTDQAKQATTAAAATTTAAATSNESHSQACPTAGYSAKHLRFSNIKFFTNFAATQCVPRYRFRKEVGVAS